MFQVLQNKRENGLTNCDLNTLQSLKLLAQTQITQNTYSKKGVNRRELTDKVFKYFNINIAHLNIYTYIEL